jgi:hypothetical protein
MSDELNENELDIDRTRLEDEWLRQPKLFLRYSRLLADAKERVDRLQGMIDVAEGELFMRVAEDADKLPKATDSMIKQAVAIKLAKNPLVKKLQLAKHKVNLLQAFVSALDQKKRALESLVTLHGQGYFSDPKATSDAGRQWIEEQQEKQVMKYNRRKKAATK